MKHAGGCHCGKIKFEVEMDLETVISCNCSICSKRGSLLAFAPSSNFKLISGEDNLTEYRFNTHRLQHLFCKTCGILSFGKAPQPEGQEVTFINARCLDGVDIKKLPVQEYDGRSK